MTLDLFLTLYTVNILTRQFGYQNSITAYLCTMNSLAQTITLSCLDYQNSLLHFCFHGSPSSIKNIYITVIIEEEEVTRLRGIWDMRGVRKEKVSNRNDVNKVFTYETLKK